MGEENVIEFYSSLTAHLFVTKMDALDGMEKMLNNLAENGITVRFYGPDDPLLNMNIKSPRVYVSLGPGWKEFQTLNDLPINERKRWLHFKSPAEIQPFRLFYCWLKNTDPLPENKTIPATRFSSETPLVSVFTASYKSKEKIQRPYRSLLNQTYSNWEWVIVDDSGDDDETVQQLPDHSKGSPSKEVSPGHSQWLYRGNQTVCGRTLYRGNFALKLIMMMS